ncbi:MAG: ureidoglycolate lyase [Rhodoferax sp.]|nr:ureidoglycolate lyase [Rhodoferax sp.]
MAAPDPSQPLGRRLPVVPLSASGFAPYGQVIEAHPDAPRRRINSGETERFHDLARVDVSRSEGRPLISLFRAQPQRLPLRLRLLERHRLGSQAFMPLSQRPYLVVVAPAGDVAAPDLTRLRAFLAGPGQGVNVAAGTWHHPLLALHETSDFLVVDRGAPEPDCDEFVLGEPGWWLQVD